MNITPFAHADTVADTREQVVKYIKDTVADTNELLSEITHSTAEEFALARARIAAKLNEASIRIDYGRHSLARKACNAADATYDCVRENPWKALGVAALAGVVIAFFVSRR